MIGSTANVLIEWLQKQFLLIADLMCYQRDISPLGLKLLVNLSFGVIADDADINEAAQVELLRSELRHGALVLYCSSCTIGAAHDEVAK